MASISDHNAQPGANLNRSHPFTCVTCAIAFRSSKMQRDHMRSDWHRYNLKRRVASLPPLSSEIFAEKVLSAQASSSAAAAKAAFRATCVSCQKTYYSENAYHNHLNSQRHRTRAAALEKTTGVGMDTPSVLSSTISLGEPLPAAREDVADAEVEEEFAQVVSSMKGTKIDDVTPPTSRRPSRPHYLADGGMLDRSSSPEGTEHTEETDATQPSTAMPLTRCLFCNYDSPTFKLSILHMSRYHALFIPEQDYLIDVEGLVRYLQAKVADNHECLFCHKLKASASGVQTHMRDKGHTMIAFDSEEEMIEIGQFYDFRSTYSDEEEISDSDSDEPTASSAASKLGAKRLNLAAEDDGDEEGWETDSDESINSDETGPIPISKDHVYRKNAVSRYRNPKGHHAAEGIPSGIRPRHAAYTDGHELHLPTGRTAGHRHFARYYRQNLHSYPTAEERLVQQRLLADAATSGDSATGPMLAAKARQLARRPVSELGLVGLSEGKRRQVTAIAQKQQTIGQRHEKQYRWRVERRANNQTHYRDDNFGIRI